jgi:hypothetical protein
VQRLHREFFAHVDNVSSLQSAGPPPRAPPPAGASVATTSNEDRENLRELERQIGTRDNTIRQMQEQMDRVLQDQVIAVTIELSQEDGLVTEQSRRDWLRGQLAEELATALDVDPERIEIIGVYAGEKRSGRTNPSLMLDVSILPALPSSAPEEPVPRTLCSEVLRQASTPHSKLRQSPTLKRAQGAVERGPRDWIDRLRATVLQLQSERQALVDDLDNVATSVQSLRTHKSERADMLSSKNQTLERQVHELSVQLRAEKEARKVQAESLVLQKDTELARMRTTVASLTEQLAGQKASIDQLQYKLGSVQAESRDLRMQAERAETEAASSRNKEQQLQVPTAKRSCPIMCSCF